MAVLKIARMGHPVLRQIARELTAEEIRSPATLRLIQDMIETMEDYEGVGLAAPQVREPIQLAIVGYEGENARYPGKGSQPLTVVFNPKVTVLDPTEQAFWEGCLSVPELRGLVHRPRKVQIDYLDEKAVSRAIVAEDFLATVFQHELDHLQGVLFVDRMRDTRQFCFLEEYRRYWVSEENEAETVD